VQVLEENEFEVKVLFNTSKRLVPNIDSVSFGKYIIEPIPSSDTGNTSATNQYLLRFKDKFTKENIGSQPDKEAENVLNLFSLWIGTKVEINSSMINSANLGRMSRKGATSNIEGILEIPPDFESLFQQLISLDNDIAIQFLRSASAYRTAVNLMGENNTLSFFLLTVSVECLSNRIIKNKGKTASFIDFIHMYTPVESRIGNEELWKELLKIIYSKVRSGFTHDGVEIPFVSDVADQLNEPYFENNIDGKMVKIPSLKWFEKVVRSCLLEFLSQQGNMQKYPKQENA
jgi:hypothetical protein